MINDVNLKKRGQRRKRAAAGGDVDEHLVSFINSETQRFCSIA